MASTALVWFRRDLRVHDHPPLRAALDACERVVPVFVLDDRLLHGRHASGSRTQFMLESLRELRTALQERGGNLVLARGTPEQELVKLAREHGAEAVYFASDASPFAIDRDRARRGGAARGGDRAAADARELRRRHRQAEAVRRLHAVLARLEGAAAPRGPRGAAQGHRAARSCAWGRSRAWAR